MIHGVADLIAFCSRYFTLEPGDVIATGTPGGVGVFRKPPRFLGDGDEVVIDIERHRRATQSLSGRRGPSGHVDGGEHRRVHLAYGSDGLDVDLPSDARSSRRRPGRPRPTRWPRCAGDPWRSRSPVRRCATSSGPASASRSRSAT